MANDRYAREAQDVDPEYWDEMTEITRSTEAKAPDRDTETAARGILRSFELLREIGRAEVKLDSARERLRHILLVRALSR